MKRILLVASAAALVFPFSARAQARADFSGTWTMDADRSESAHTGAPAEPVTLIIKQTPSVLNIETRRREGSQTWTYKLDGSETLQPGLEGEPPTRTVARWEGAKLVTETIVTLKGMTVTVREVRGLDVGSKEMTVESSAIIQHGYTSSSTLLQGYNRPYKDVFTKMAP